MSDRSYSVARFAHLVRDTAWRTDMQQDTCSKTGRAQLSADFRRDQRAKTASKHTSTITCSAGFCLRQAGNTRPSFSVRLTLCFKVRDGASLPPSAAWRAWPVVASTAAHGAQPRAERWRRSGPCTAAKPTRPGHRMPPCSPTVCRRKTAKSRRHKALRKSARAIASAARKNRERDTQPTHVQSLKAVQRGCRHRHSAGRRSIRPPS